MRLSTTVIIGLLVGLALAFSLVFLLESLDRRIKSVEEFEREYRLSGARRRAAVGVPLSARDEREELLEPYRILRSALDFAAVTRQLDTLLVTSAVSGEGKTTVAVDLAHADRADRTPHGADRARPAPPDVRAPARPRRRGGLTTALHRRRAAAELLVEPLPELPNFSVLPVRAACPRTPPSCSAPRRSRR